MQNIKEIETIRKNWQFIAEILNAPKVQNESLQAFDEFIATDYTNFANEVSFTEEIELFNKLNAIRAELIRIASLKAIANKAVVAVGGGFSAGKSQFITSFFENSSIKLPIGVQPVTAIASYIIHAEKNSIKGYTHNEGVVDIPTKLYANLSHDFIKTLGFNLKTILPMIVMQTPIPEYSHICFVDTPGYNPANTGFAATDSQTAKEYLINANALIWVVGLDSNGTIPSKDLEFLQDLDIENKQLYIVANKADLKSPSSLEEILDTFEEVLDENFLDYVGISAYDSTNKKELAYRKENLSSFLNSVNKDIVSKEQIADELNEVFITYKKHLLTENNKQKELKRKFNALKLDIYGLGGDEILEKTEWQINDIEKLISDETIVKQLNKLETLRTKAFEKLDSIFLSILGEKLKEYPSFEVVVEKKESKKEYLSDEVVDGVVEVNVNEEIHKILARTKNEMEKARKDLHRQFEEMKRENAGLTLYSILKKLGK